ncbi:major myo-inositol transporter IolT-like [Odontomachus brunneus]|uniref:major myo-inositol transporter IolT-like n=1 Tax=Odontomachus brunneus TaxID=486640 RepID=UPI0013F1C802|nr:major myo-inositol transporter IolT-like [Odontomachus brunneus]
MPVATSSFGMAAGAFLFGSISDTAGRKKSIAVSTSIIFCASASLSFAQTNFLINLSVFILGLGVAGNNTVLRVYLIECLSMRKRGTCLAVIDTLWVIGYLTALVLVILYGVPSLVIACASGLLPSSPRYSLYRRKPRQALAVLRQMYAINNSKHADTYPVRNLENCVRPDEGTNQDSDDFVDRLQGYFTKTWKRICRIHKSPYKRTTLCGVLACLLHFPGFAWLALWNTHVLQELEKNTVDENGTCNVSFQNVVLGFLQNCDQMNEDRFYLLLLVSLGYVLGELLLIIGIDVVGRKPYLISSGIVGGVATLALIFRMHHAPRVVLSSVFLAAYAIGRTTTCVSLMENYPTALRGTTMGLTKILPHLAVSATLHLPTTTCSLSAAFVMLPVLDLTRLPMKE